MKALVDKKIRFIDLEAQQSQIRERINERINRVLDHGKYIMGPEVQELEEVLTNYVGAQYCISCASGTDALLMALMAYDVGPGDAIFTTPFTFIATAEVIALLGATSVFVDIDPQTFNIDPEKLKEAIAVTQKESKLKVRGIIPVDLFGQPADYDTIETVAKEFDLFVLEDAAQSFGATYNGKKTCSFGDMAATSFFPAKPLGCYGDGGAVFTESEKLAKKLRSIRVHGKGEHKYDNVRTGINGRLDTLQAAILLEKLAVCGKEIELRNEIAQRYSEGLRGRVKTPIVKADRTSVWAQYSLLSERRYELMAQLKTKGVPTAIYYPTPLHLQSAFSLRGYKRGDFPISEQIADTILSLPMHPYLEQEEQDYIIATIIQLLAEA